MTMSKKMELQVSVKDVKTVCNKKETSPYRASNISSRDNVLSQLDGMTRFQFTFVPHLIAEIALQPSFF